MNAFSSITKKVQTIAARANEASIQAYTRVAPIFGLMQVSMGSGWSAAKSFGSALRASTHAGYVGIKASSATLNASWDLGAATGHRVRALTQHYYYQNELAANEARKHAASHYESAVSQASEAYEYTKESACSAFEATLHTLEGAASTVHSAGYAGAASWETLALVTEAGIAATSMATKGIKASYTYVQESASSLYTPAFSATTKIAAPSLGYKDCEPESIGPFLTC